ncbi:putative gibberellin 20-oxidase [Microdochium trichocladiopsis]|uniref:Gibberellin 20-oxidase n=1 Tax=Microdochium trichocladiopsis TaxID=1682393 RepID=A0A9P8Y0J7_9PEZI|nr:putative gibberellin 20-oxidase [Microdochium trichocladiopsis]KAH7027598.1 putative gibberellin 20-oxidase [Microdochium trichocladiopsis]
MGSAGPLELETLDFGKFLDGTPAERQDVANRLVRSLTQHGFTKLINHEVPDDVVDGIWYWGKKLFALAPEQKDKFKHLPGPDPQRGWSHIGAEVTSRLQERNFADGVKNRKEELKDEKEHFDCGPPNDPDFPNLWPDDADLPGFREFMEKYFIAAQKTCMTILAAIEVGLGIPEGSIQEMCKPDASELRMLYYPEVSIETLRSGKIKRAWPHTDFGIITLLFQDSLGGLELEDRRQDFAFVPVITERRNEMVVNLSDTFGRWSNGQMPPGVHQVNLPPSLLDKTEGVVPERYSSVFFFKAHRGANVGPLAPFVSEKTPAKYPEMTALEFHRQMTKILY